MKIEQLFDFIKINKKWFKKTFETISEEHSNSETIENIKIVDKNGGKEITFSVECGCGGIHKDNTITINDRGYISMNLSEIINGGDIDGRLEIAIKEAIKI